ncbi:YggT family protein [Moraxella sp. VT-16-12]|nr:YggT family protein [Moraxella sp. VT-16-12]
MNDPLTIIFNIVVNFALLVIFLRFMFQFAEIDKNHPYAKATYNISAVVSVFGRIFPDLDKGRISLSAVVLMLLLTYIKIAGMASILGKPLDALTLFFAGTLGGILSFVSMLKYIVLGSVIFSWVILLANKMHPVMDLVMQMAEPIIAPFRRITPNLGMFDFSTLVAIMALALIELSIEIIGANILERLS